MSSPWSSNPADKATGTLPEAETLKCPGCGCMLDGFTSAALAAVRPKPGDISICLYCGLPLQYHGEPIALRELDGEELILARAHPDFRKIERLIRIKRGLDLR